MNRLSFFKAILGLGAITVTAKEVKEKAPGLIIGVRADGDVIVLYNRSTNSITGNMVWTEIPLEGE